MRARGAVVSFSLIGDEERTINFVNKLNLIKKAEGLGGCKTTINIPF